MDGHSISCFLFPAGSFTIVLPQAVVVEIVKRPELSEKAINTGWYKGQFNWRSESVALVSIEELCAASVRDQISGSLIAILHALQEDSKLRFYAIELRAIPRSVSIGQNSLTDVSDKVVNCNYIAGETLFENYRVLIPNLRNIERKVQQQTREIPSDKAPQGE